MSIKSMSKSDILIQLSNYNTRLSKKEEEYIPLNELKLLSKSDLIKIYEYRSSRPELYKSNLRDESSEHASKELERQRQIGEDIEKERKKPRGLAVFENPRVYPITVGKKPYNFAIFVQHDATPMAYTHTLDEAAAIAKDLADLFGMSMDVRQR